MKKEQKENKYLKLIKDLSKNKRGKAILFFAFYFVFFFLLITTIRTSYETNQKRNSQKTINTPYKLTKIEAGNYHFTREEVVDNVKINFVGDKENNKTTGIMTREGNVTNYFIYDNITLVRNNQKYETSPELYNFDNITNDKMIAHVLKKSTLISKTEYEEGKTIYNYQITTNTLDDILYNHKIDLATAPNTITLETNSENEVDKISYDLSSYGTYYYNTPHTINITITYQAFGKVKPISVPENN